ncbi:hypothetical protein MIND_01402300 [Mycena indigotica]|uniref:Uncharacterized protein n=1 Tax=Mycena indigotica TaxID=2126181 RepID=A0A8H6RYU8_9AGAR|nr:uncharacterized protein MIND_01402300 [Mycena indigotica]KAF7288866.1 hypothetical protein MIND_01402300 [Mycena indigotica]
MRRTLVPTSRFKLRIVHIVPHKAYFDRRRPRGDGRCTGRWGRVYNALHGARQPPVTGSSSASLSSPYPTLPYLILILTLHFYMPSFTVYCDAPDADPFVVATPVVVPPTTTVTAKAVPARGRPVKRPSYAAKENLHPTTGKRRRAPAVGAAVARPIVLAVRPVDAQPVKRAKLDLAKGKSKIPKRLPRLSEEFIPATDFAAAYDAAFGLNLEVDLAALLGKVSLKDVEKEERLFSQSTSKKSPRLAASTSALPEKHFTTPEREYIYSAFTFTTPSPISLTASSSGPKGDGQASPTPKAAWSDREALRFKF